MTEQGVFIFATISTLLIVWWTVVAAKRIYFHPLSSVPGPKLAVISRGYVMYYDLMKGGRLPWKIIELHKKYGSVVRLAPSEVHIADSSRAPLHFLTKANKYAPYQHRFGIPEATSETVDGAFHKLRYAALAPVFSRRAVNDLEPVILAKVEKVCGRLAEFYSPKTTMRPRPVNIRHLILCMTTDTLTEYAFPFCFDVLEDPELAPHFHQMLEQALRKMQWFKHFPILWDLMRLKAVSSLIGRLVPGFAMTQKFEDKNKKIIKDVIKYYDVEGAAEVEKRVEIDTSPLQPNSMGQGRSTVFHRLLNSDLPPNEKSFDRPWQEGSSLMGAGTETVANLQTYILVQLHYDQALMAKLHSELAEAMPGDAPLLPWAKLENLPYLSAVISEGLRMAVSVVNRVLRLAR